MVSKLLDTVAICSVASVPLLASISHAGGNLKLPAKITREERIWGLSLIWSEAKYNFAYFSRQPDLDWDQAYREYLSQVEAAENDLEYYRILERFIALLQDGHTNLWLPDYLKRYRATPPVGLRIIRDQVVVVEVKDTEEIRKAGLVPGSVVLAVDGTPVAKVMDRLRPYIPAAGPGERASLTGRLLEGEEGTKVALKFRTSTGKERRCTLTRTGESRPWWNRPTMTSRMLEDGIALVTINTFSYEQVTQDFKWELATMTGLRGLIIDLRNNGGGSTPTAIASALTDRTLRGNRARTRQYLPAFRAWGRPEGWYATEPWTAPGSDHALYLGPLVVLISEVTCSASEDFLAYLKDRPRTRFVGAPSFGSTGQPLFYRAELPGGGGFRICTLYITLADGEEFMGVGIPPDVEIYPTSQDITAGRDVVLEKGRDVLKGMMEEEGDEVWRTVPLLNIPKWDTGAGETPSPAQTEAFVGSEGALPEKTVVEAHYDSAALHLTFFCQQKKPLMAKETEHDGRVWEDDGVEVFLMPPKGETFYHFIVNTNNARWDEKKGYWSSWDGVWFSDVERTEEGYRVTVEIPFSTLGRQTPEPGEIWRGNFFRNYPADPAQRFSGWSFAELYHTTEAFGVLAF